MTMGNMGENYELLALKSAGISLPKIMRPLLILIFFVSIGSFFLANDITPLAFKKMSALIYDIRQHAAGAPEHGRIFAAEAQKQN